MVHWLSSTAIGLVVAAAGAAGAPPQKDYVGAFCAPVVLGDGTSALMEHLSQWEAKPAPDALADAARPEDADAPGQLFQLPGASAPAAFLDRRRGGCVLVFSSARTPPEVTEELSTETLPVGDKGVASSWRKISRPRFGPPGPARFFMKVGESDGFGLCSVIYEDLRLKDGSPATMVKVSACHLRPNETLDNG